MRKYLTNLPHELAHVTLAVAVTSAIGWLAVLANASEGYREPTNLATILGVITNVSMVLTISLLFLQSYLDDEIHKKESFNNEHRKKQD